MNDLRTFWNTSNTAIPADKDPSAYATERAKLFPPNSVVCDLGGGIGTDSLFFASQGHTVKLLDISDKGLEQAKTAAAKLGLAKSIDTLQCDLNNARIPLADKSYNIVYSRLSLHYFVPAVLTQLFSEIYRILQPGGSAYLTLKGDSDKQEIQYLKQTAISNEPGVFHEGSQIKTRFTRDELAAMLHDAGLSVNEYTVSLYTEKLAGRKDRVKSGAAEFRLNEIIIHKAS